MTINYRLVNWSVVPQANLSIIRVSGLVINSREKKRLFMTLSVYCQCKEILLLSPILPLMSQTSFDSTRNKRGDKKNLGN